MSVSGNYTSADSPEYIRSSPIHSVQFAHCVCFVEDLEPVKRIEERFGYLFEVITSTAQTQ